MRGGHGRAIGWAGWIGASAAIGASPVAGCRDPNPYFVEPPLTTSGGGASEGVTGSSGASTAGPTPTTSGGPDESSGSISDSDTSMITATTTTTATTGGVCSDGEIVCDGATAQVCDGAGGYKSSEACSSACAAGLGCVLCAPTTARCVGDALELCADDGAAWAEVETCDPLQGLSCDADLGRCTGLCTPDTLGQRHLGCDFYGASLASLHSGDPWSGSYGLIAVNAGLAAAALTVTLGASVVAETSVAPGNATTIPLPYVAEVSQSGFNDGTVSVLVADGAYRLRSTLPLVVYQYEPLAEAGTGDASLLLPVHTWGEDHVAASWPFWLSPEEEPLAGFYAVIAGEDDTLVTLTPPTEGGPVAAADGIVDSAGNGAVVLDAGSVLEVFAGDGGDLTGTRIVADRPVAVFGGHRCAQVPSGTPYCDHLEESMPPITALAREYVVSPPRGPDDEDRPQVIRVIATEDATNLSYEPDQDLAIDLDAAGDWLEIGPTTERFVITADRKVLVAQYLTGGNFASDPSMAVAIPTQQFRDFYPVAASSLFTSRWVDVIAPSGATVQLNANNIGPLIPIGASGLGVGSVALPDTDVGASLLTADQPFAAMLYGHGSTTSFWYAGGLELLSLP